MRATWGPALVVALAACSKTSKEQRPATHDAAPAAVVSNVVLAPPIVDVDGGVGQTRIAGNYLVRAAVDDGTSLLLATQEGLVSASKDAGLGNVLLPFEDEVPVGLALVKGVAFFGLFPFDPSKRKPRIADRVTGRGRLVAYELATSTLKVLDPDVPPDLFRIAATTDRALVLRGTTDGAEIDIFTPKLEKRVLTVQTSKEAAWGVEDALATDGDRFAWMERNVSLIPPKRLTFARRVQVRDVAEPEHDRPPLMLAAKTNATNFVLDGAGVYVGAEGNTIVREDGTPEHRRVLVKLAHPHQSFDLVGNARYLCVLDHDDVLAVPKDGASAVRRLSTGFVRPCLAADAKSFYTAEHGGLTALSLE
ncbi:MAG: hypothetical protein U0270_37635 [Labilithrix sp.]